MTARDESVIDLNSYRTKRAQDHMVVRCEPHHDEIKRVKLNWSPRIDEKSRARLDKALSGFRDKMKELADESKLLK